MENDLAIFGESEKIILGIMLLIRWITGYHLEM